MKIRKEVKNIAQKLNLKFLNCQRQANTCKVNARRGTHVFFYIKSQKDAFSKKARKINLLTFYKLWKQNNLTKRKQQSHQLQSVNFSQSLK